MEEPEKIKKTHKPPIQGENENHNTIVELFKTAKHPLKNKWHENRLNLFVSNNINVENLFLRTNLIPTNFRNNKSIITYKFDYLLVFLKSASISKRATLNNDLLLKFSIGNISLLVDNKFLDSNRMHPGFRS